MAPASPQGVGAASSPVRMPNGNQMNNTFIEQREGCTTLSGEFFVRQKPTILFLCLPSQESDARRNRRTAHHIGDSIRGEQIVAMLDADGKILSIEIL
jgi:hypothetical protein